jgi:cytochrome c-type biogenesis protein CcmF
MNEIGEYSLLVGFGVSVYAVVASFWGAKTGGKQMIKSAEYAMAALFMLVSISSIALINALYANDFSLEYVYSYTSRDLGGFYRITAFWAGQKGSLLFWSWILGFFSVWVVLQNANKNRALMPYVVFILAVTQAFFMLRMNVPSPVFERMAVLPPDGHGLNPMLQNPGMVFHPPALYLGYVGFAIPFAFAMAALFTGHLGDVWIRTTRRWTIFSWLFLTLGNLLGANWAYVELGWGGYWAWDPVENASFMPWLTGTAFLHSVMIQEKKDMLKTWNVSLISLTFILTIFGTFITRSGLISSVHSFGESTVGTYFGFFLILVILFSAGVIAWRLPLLKSANSMDSILSREASFMFNNLLLVGAAFAVFWGTMFPMISELVKGEKITVGPAFFNQVMTPIGLGLLLLTGICPLIAWRKATSNNTQKNFLIPILITAAGSVILWVSGVREFTPWISFTICVFVASAILTEIVKGVIARSASGKENYASALLNLMWKNKRRYGGYTIHIGVIMTFVGFTGSWYNQDKEASIFPGGKIAIKDYVLTYYKNDYSKPKDTVEETVATLLIEKGGKKVGYAMPEHNMYHMKNANGEGTPQPASEVSIYSTMVEDLYVTYASLNEDGSATFKVHVNPLVKWLWIGSLVMAAGSLFSMWPDKREKKRFEARHGVA